MIPVNCKFENLQDEVYRYLFEAILVGVQHLTPRPTSMLWYILPSQGRPLDQRRSRRGLPLTSYSSKNPLLLAGRHQ